jgi:two-component system phosphate regulon sensor histidine kinase PhoR
VRLRLLGLFPPTAAALTASLLALLGARLDWPPTVWVLLALAGGVAGGSLAALAAQRRLVVRLDELREAVGRYAAGELGGRLTRLGTDELTPLASALDAAFRQVDRRMADLEHDRVRTEAIVGGMVEGVLVVDEVGRVQLVNGAARHMLRMEVPAVGRRYLELIRQPDLCAQISRALRGETPGGLELALTHDQARTLVTRAAPVTADRRGGAVVVLHDITDLRRADRIRRDFVANVSHELRTPLTAIRGYVEALLDGDPEEQTGRFLEIIARHSARMERLVKDLLRLARLDAGQERIEPRACDVETLFDEVTAELSPGLEARRQQVRTEVAPDAARVAGDAEKLHDVLRNLLENASNYSPGGSTITLASSREGDWALLTVLDEGPGVPEVDLTRIFERFYRVDRARSRETGGTGLGLSIVKHLVELHGGRVTAANRPGGGAVFTVAIPAAPATTR